MQNKCSKKPRKNQGKHFWWSIFTNQHATLWKRDSSTVVFLWIMRNLYEHPFYRTLPDDCCWVLQYMRDKNEGNNILTTDLDTVMASNLYANEHTSIHQTTSACKNKAKPYIKSQAKIITFFIWPRGVSENMFEVKRLAHLQAGG